MWRDEFEEDVREKRCGREEVLDRMVWRSKIKEGNADPIYTTP